MYTKQVDANTLVDYYDSLYETITCARIGDPKRPSSNVNVSKQELDAACDNALYGWPEGLAQLEKRILRFESKLPTFSSPRVNKFNTSIGQLDHTRFIMGHPNMLRRRVKTVTTPISGHGKVIRIVYNYAISPDIGATDRFDSAAAIVVAIKSLELNGYETELIMVNGNYSYSANHHIVTVAKAAGQPLSLESIAFLLCRREMDRNIAFSLFDRWDDAEHERMRFSKLGGVYFGATSYYPPEYEQSIKIGAYSTQDPDFIPVKRGDASVWIKGVLSKYGIELSE